MTPKKKKKYFLILSFYPLFNILLFIYGVALVWQTGYPAVQAVQSVQTAYPAAQAVQTAYPAAQAV